MTSLGDLRSALMAVPTTLLAAEDRRVHADALVALDALERIDVVPTSVAFVGSSGSGKSTLVNAVLGMPLAPEGVARPTTTVTSMYGGSGPVSLSAASEYVHVPTMAPGLLVIDTPAWEHDRAAVVSAMAVADLIVVVVTPSRYADASVAAMIEAMPARRPSAVVLNRISVPGADRELLVSSARAVLGAPIVQLDEAGDVEQAMEALIDALAIDATDYARAAVLRSGAAVAGAHTARAVAGAAPTLLRMESTVGTFVVPGADGEVRTVFDDWPATRADMVLTTEGAIRSIDEAISQAVDPTMGRAIAATLDRFEPGAVAVELDAWRERTIDRVTEAARVRWRPKATRDLLSRFGWRTAVNADVTAPKRYARLLGARRRDVERASRLDLIAVLDDPRVERLDAWRAAIGELSSYAPGELLSASRGFSPEGEDRA